jgi:hypothetical protein
VGDFRKTVIKGIEVRSDRDPDLYNILVDAQSRKENIASIVRSLLLRELLPSYLVSSGADVGAVLKAIASLRRSIDATEEEIDLLKLWCRQKMGSGEISLPPQIAKPTQQESFDALDPEPKSREEEQDPICEGTEAIADNW